MDGCGSPSSPNQVGVATSTVRYYERIGLLTVGASRPPSGYREYDERCGRAAAVRRPRPSDGPGLRPGQLVLPIWAGTTASPLTPGRPPDRGEAGRDRRADRGARAVRGPARRGAQRVRRSVGAAGVSGRPHLLRARVARRALLGLGATLLLGDARSLEPSGRLGRATLPGRRSRGRGVGGLDEPLACGSAVGELGTVLARRDGEYAVDQPRRQPVEQPGPDRRADVAGVRHVVRQLDPAVRRCSRPDHPAHSTARSVPSARCP